MNAANSLTKYRMEQIAAALQAGPMCAHDLAPKVFLCFEQARRYLQFMHGQGQVHIAKWTLRRTPRATRVAAYAAGPGQDAPRPEALTNAQRQRRSIHSARQDGNRYALIRAKDRARKLKPTRDPLITAMFGAPAARATTEGVSHA